MKTCTKCKTVKDDNKFSKKGNSLNTWCKECVCLYSKKHYLDNSLKRKEQIRKREQDLILWLREYKSHLQCTICGENHPACIQFHHKDRLNKKFELNKIRRFSIEIAKKEIEKCDVLCGNCHAKLHWEEKYSNSSSV
jgi:hypothetical protein